MKDYQLVKVLDKAPFNRGRVIDEEDLKRAFFSNGNSRFTNWDVARGHIVDGRAGDGYVHHYYYQLYEHWINIPNGAPRDYSSDKEHPYLSDKYVVVRDWMERRHTSSRASDRIDICISYELMDADDQRLIGMPVAQNLVQWLSKNSKDDLVVVDTKDAE